MWQSNKGEASRRPTFSQAPLFAKSLLLVFAGESDSAIGSTAWARMAVFAPQAAGQSAVRDQNSPHIAPAANSYERSVVLVHDQTGASGGSRIASIEVTR